MKTRIKLLSLLLLSLLSQSCMDNFLNELPKSNQSANVFFRTAEETENAVNAIYTSLRNQQITGLQLNAIASDVQGLQLNTSFDGFAAFTFTGYSTTIRDIWQRHYEAIARANYVITNLEGRTDLTNATTAVAEARFLRAFFYFNLVRLFGDVPIITKVYTDLDREAMKVPRSPEAEVFKLILEDLTFAEANLKQKGEVPFGKATKGAAQTMLAKVNLTLGSYAQRDKTGDGKQYFQTAVDKAKAVINSGKYNLVKYYPDNFIRETKYNDEVILAVNYKVGTLTGGCVGCTMGFVGVGGTSSTDAVNNGGTFGVGLNATEYFVTMFETSDSIRRFWTTENAGILKDNVTTSRTYGKYVLRSYENPAYYYPQNATDRFPTVPPATNPGFGIGKYRRWPVRDANYTHDNWDMNQPIFRLAEVYLILGEAANELAGAPTADAYDAVNKVRDRARYSNSVGGVREDILPRNLKYNAAAVPDWKGLSYTQFRDQILDERARELAFEMNTRFFDLTRRGIYYERVQALASFINPYTKRTSEPTIVAAQVKPFHAKLPIPERERLINDKLTQNPGY